MCNIATNFSAVDAFCSFFLLFQDVALAPGGKRLHKYLGNPIYVFGIVELFFVLHMLTDCCTYYVYIFGF